MKILTIFAIGLWLGVMGFFSFAAAPALFATLDRESAGRVVTVILPRYYAFGMVMGGLALGSVVGRAVLAQRREVEWGSLVLTLLMLALTGYSMLVLLPQAEAARMAMRSVPAQAGMVSEAASAFGRAHRLSVALNLLTMLAGLTLVLIEGVRTRLSRRP